MSFSTLPPDSRTLVFQMKYKTCSYLKIIILLLSPGKTPLMTTVAKFLDMSVCGGSWCLDPTLSPFLVKFTQIFESILFDNPHKAAVLSVGCASFSSTLFPSTQLSVNMLGYSTLNRQLLWQWMFVAYSSCEGCQWLSSGQLSDQQSSPWLCSLVNQTETILKAQETFAGVLSWLADWHVTIFVFVEIVNWGAFVKCEPKSSQLKEPKT